MKYETVMKLNNERVYYDFEKWPFHAKHFCINYVHYKII